MLALCAAAAVVPALVFAFRSGSEPPCGRTRDAVAAVWNAPVASRLAASFDRAGMTTTGLVVTRGLDDYTGRWGDMHVASCTATHVRGEQSAALLDRRTRCLHERLSQVAALIAALIAALESADRITLGRAGEAVARLSPVADCGDLVALAAPRPVSSDPVVRERLSGAWLELARVRAVASLGEGRTLAQIEPIIALAVALRDPVLIADARLVLADALAADLQLARAREGFAEAELAAEVAGNDDLRARALIAHATVVGALDQGPASGAQLLVRARAVIDRLGARRDLGRRMLVAEAALAIARGNHPEGERHLRAVLAELPTTGAEGVLRVIALRDLANVLGEQGRHPEAAGPAREAVALAEALLGPDHLDVAETLSVLALTLHFIGEDLEARVLARRAITIKERARGPDHLSLSSTIMVLALIERDATRAGAHAEARRLTDRAIELRRAGYGADNPLTLSLVSERGSLAVDAGELALARTSFDAAIPGLERAWGPARRQSSRRARARLESPSSRAMALAVRRSSPR